MNRSHRRVELAEYQQRHVAVPPPTEADLRVAQRLNVDRDHPRLQVRWLANGDMDVTASAWVGVVRFSHVDVHVTPKYVGGALPLLKMLDFTRATHCARRVDSRRTMDATGEHLLELIAQLLADETSVLIREGLQRSYQTHHDDLTLLRGRLDHRTQVLRRFGRLDRLHCTFDEHDLDQPDNQLLCAAVAMARNLVEGRRLRADLTRIHATLTDICRPPTLNPTWYRQRITYSRLNERYRAAHDLAYLLLDHTGFDDLYGTSGTLSVPAFMLDMNQLFERFVTRLLEVATHDSELEVSTHHRLRATIIDSTTNTTYASIDPDLVVRHRSDGRPIPVDVKYKRYDDKKLGTGDLYQSFTYALALAHGYASGKGRAGILYPGASTRITDRLDINPGASPSAARITAASLDIPSLLSEIDTNGRISVGAQGQLLDLLRGITGRELALTERATTRM